MLSKISRVRLRHFHRWTGIFLGVQLLFWVSSGVYFAWMPIKVVKDEDRKAAISVEPLPLNQLVAPVSLTAPDGTNVKAVHLESSPLGVIYRLESVEGAVSIYDAYTGKALPMLPLGKAAELALKQISSEPVPYKVRLMPSPEGDYKGPVPAYQVTLDDFRRTRLYVNPWTGKIIVARNMFWRIYDFLWMLHIMDFKEREDFNNPWLKGLSLGALIFVLSGYALFVYGRPPKKPSRAS